MRRRRIAQGRPDVAGVRRAWRSWRLAMAVIPVAARTDGPIGRGERPELHSELPGP